MSVVFQRVFLFAFVIFVHLFYILWIHIYVRYSLKNGNNQYMNLTDTNEMPKEKKGTQPESNNPCGNFSEEFPKRFEENLNIVLNYRFKTVPPEILERLKLDTAGIEMLSKNFTDAKTPVIVTAASTNHFEEAQGLIEMLTTRYRGFKVIFYDIGLTSNQSSIFRKHCKCEFRTFPFESYPDFFRILLNFTWKPVIIQLVLMDYDFVMWMDSSIRLNGSPLDDFFMDARKAGIKVLGGRSPIVRQTHLNTFKALGETPCLYQGPELQAGWSIVSRTNFTLRAIMRPWVSCALQYGCMAQDNAALLYKGRSRRFHENHLCHRFDQSVISIILTRLYNDRMKSVRLTMGKIGGVWRGNKSHYLEMLDGKW